MHLASNSRAEAAYRWSVSKLSDASTLCHAASNVEAKRCVVSASKALFASSESIGITILPFRRRASISQGQDLRLQPPAMATHVSVQITTVDRGMSLDSKESHRGTTIRAFRATTPFGSGQG